MGGITPPPSCPCSGFSDKQKNNDIADQTSFLWLRRPRGLQLQEIFLPAATGLLDSVLAVGDVTLKSHSCIYYTSH